jgi:hypothetical protein
VELQLETVLQATTTLLLLVSGFFLSRFASKVDKLSDSVVSLSQSVAILDSEHRSRSEEHTTRLEEQEKRAQIHWTTQRVWNKEMRVQHQLVLDRLGALERNDG